MCKISTWLLVVILVCCIGCASATQLNVTSLEQILSDSNEYLLAKLSDFLNTRRLIDRQILQNAEEMGDTLVHLGKRLETFEDANRNLTSRIIKLERQVQKLGQPVAFSAQVTTSLANIQRNQVIVFGTVLSNAGEAYNASSGNFVAPVTGLYQFYVSILSWVEKSIETQLMVNREVRMQTYSSGNAHFQGSLGSNTVILKLLIHDTVWVQVHENRGDYVHHGWSTFSGNLLMADL